MAVTPRRLGFWVALAALLAGVTLVAQQGPAGSGPESAIPVRCVNTLGTAFEACGGGGAAGTDVNISGVGGVAVVATLPVSGTFWQMTQPVSGTFWQATQPVSGTFWQATQPVSGPITDAQLRASAVPVSGTFFQATQPVSAASLPLPALAATSTKQSDGSQKTQVVDGAGNVIGATSNALDINIKSGNPTTIQANAGTNLNTSALALSATQTDRSQKTQITDGTRDGTIKAASTAALATDTSYVMALSPNSPVPTGTNSIGQVTSNAGTNTSTANLDVALSTRLKPADTLAAVTTVTAVTSITNPVSTKTAITGNAPIAASVGVASAQALALNASRKGAAFINTSSTATISCTSAATAVLNAGITLQPGSVWNMNEYTFTTAAIVCIASAAATNLSIQEFQ